MKTIRFSSVVMLFFLALTANANPTPTPTFDDGILITDANQKVIMHTTTTDLTAATMQDYIKKFTASQTLKSGEYKMTLTKGNARITQVFNVKDEDVLLIQVGKNTTYTPFFNVKADKLDVNYFMGRYNDIVLKIYDKDGILHYSDTYLNVVQLQNRYDLSTLPTGSYQVEIKAGNEVFNHTILK